MYLTVFDRLFDVPKERKNASYKASVYVVFCLCHFFQSIIVLSCIVRWMFIGIVVVIVPS